MRRGRTRGVRAGLAALGALLLGAAVAAAAQTPLPARLSVAGDVAFPPYSYLAGGQAAGIDVDILAELSRRTGIEFDLQLMPFKRVIESLREGRIDAGMAVLRSPQREDFAIFTGVLHNSTYALFVPAGSTLAFDGLDSLRGRHIGKVRGFYVSEDFDAEAAAGRIRVTEAATSEQSLRMLLAGRVEAISGQLVVMQHVARELGLADRLQALPRPLAPDRPAFLVLSRQSPLRDKEALAQRLRLALEAMHKDGSVQRIESRYAR